MQAKSEVQKLIVKAQDGALEAQPGRTIMESFEGQVTLQSTSLIVLDSVVLLYCCSRSSALYVHLQVGRLALL